MPPASGNAVGVLPVDGGSLGDMRFGSDLGVASLGAMGFGLGLRDGGFCPCGGL